MYIRINLLPKEFRPRKSLIRLDVKALLIMILLAVAVGMIGYYAYLMRESGSLQSRITMLRTEQEKLKAVVDLQHGVRDLQSAVDDRVEVVQSLTTGSEVRIAILQHITRILPQNLWLETITESSVGGVVTFDIEGMSYTKEGISQLLAGLQDFEQFSGVKLEAIAPAPLEIRDAFSFIVNAELGGGNVDADTTE